MLVQDTAECPTPAQVRLLRAHLPFSLTVLRRFQVAAGAYDDFQSDGSGSDGGVGGDGGRAGTSPDARVLFAYDADREVDVGPQTPFATVFLELGRMPQTAAWIYASDQDSAPQESFYEDDDTSRDTWAVDRGAELVAAWSAPRRARCRRLVLALLRRARHIARTTAPALTAQLEKQAPGSSAGLTTAIKANVHDGVRYVLQHPAPDDGDTAAVTMVYWDAYDKWLGRRADVPAPSQPDDATIVVDGDGDTASAAASAHLSHLAWDRVRTTADATRVISRTAIPRTPQILLSVPSVALRERGAINAVTSATATPGASGAIQAWAFLGIDGSLWTLHTEPAYRGRGLATMLAARLMRQYVGLFDAAAVGHGNNDGCDGCDDWYAADVSAHNQQSQRVCRRLGARRAWSTSW